MNKLQKAYDSYDKTNMHLKMVENLYHQKNLYLIKNRKNKYSPPSAGITHQNRNLMYQYKVQKDNEKLYAKVRQINRKVPKPKINDDFVRVDAKKKIFNQITKEREQQFIDQENRELYGRIRMLKSFINVKEMDEEYKNQHMRLVRKCQKIDGSCVLPSIRQQEKLIKTEASRTEREPEETKNNEEPEEQKQD